MKQQHQHQLQLDLHSVLMLNRRENASSVVLGPKKASRLMTVKIVGSWESLILRLNQRYP